MEGSCTKDGPTLEFIRDTSAVLIVRWLHDASRSDFVCKLSRSKIGAGKLPAPTSAVNSREVLKLKKSSSDGVS
jgi:hypothetical protein